MPRTWFWDWDRDQKSQKSSGHQRAPDECISPWPDYKLDFAKSLWPEKSGKCLSKSTASVAAPMLVVKLYIRKGCQGEQCYGPPQPLRAGWQVTAFISYWDN